MPRHPENPLVLTRDRNVANKNCPCSDCRKMTVTGSHYYREAIDPCDLCGETGKYRYQLIELPQLILEYGWRNVCWCCRNTMNSYVYYKWGLCWQDPYARFALLEWWLNRYNTILRYRNRDGIPDLRHGRDRWLYALRGAD